MKSRAFKVQSEVPCFLPCHNYMSIKLRCVHTFGSILKHCIICINDNRNPLITPTPGLPNSQNPMHASFRCSRKHFDNKRETERIKKRANQMINLEKKFFLSNITHIMILSPDEHKTSAVGNNLPHLKSRHISISFLPE